MGYLYRNKQGFCLSFSGIFVVPLPAKGQETVQNGSHCVTTFERNRQHNIQCQNAPICIDISLQCTLPHVLLPLSWRAIKLPNGSRRQENTCFCSTRLSLYKVTGLDLLRYRIMALSVMEIKLTGNSSTNETDKRTNHVLSKMSARVI